jgi:hypothetical protein
MKYTVYFITGHKGHTGPSAWQQRCGGRWKKMEEGLETYYPTAVLIHI